MENFKNLTWTEKDTLIAVTLGGFQPTTGTNLRTPHGGVAHQPPEYHRRPRSIHAILPKLLAAYRAKLSPDTTFAFCDGPEGLFATLVIPGFGEWSAKADRFAPAVFQILYSIATLIDFDPNSPLKIEDIHAY